jgi:epoxide hydrolase
MGHWSQFDAAGHFPALETPALLAADTREFFAKLR